MPSRHSASSMRATFRASAMPSVRSNEALKERKTMESIGKEHVLGVGHAKATKANNQRSGTKRNEVVQYQVHPSPRSDRNLLRSKPECTGPTLGTRKNWQIGRLVQARLASNNRWSLILSQVAEVEDIGMDSMEFPWHVGALKPTGNLTFLKRFPLARQRKPMHCLTCRSM